MIIMHRSFDDSRGFNLPKNIAYKINNKFVTYEEIKKEKIKKQKRHLEYKRSINIIIEKPCYLWVFYNDTFFVGGWWLYLRTSKGDISLNFRCRNKELKLMAMKAYPLGYLPIEENFYKWMVEFEKVFHKDSDKRKKNAIALATARIKNGQLIEIISKKQGY